MRVFSVPPDQPPLHSPAVVQAAHTMRTSPQPCDPPAFLPFCAEAFSQAHARQVPVFLLLGGAIEAFSDPALSMHLRERTVPVHLPIGVRPDVELLCQRAAALFSQEGALPLCALLLDDARPFLAAPLPPSGYPLDPARLYIWLAQADRRFVQNLPGLHAQAAQVLLSFRCDPLRKPYIPADAAHDLLRALSAAEDRANGGFGSIKAPLVCTLRFLQHAPSGANRQAQASLNRTLNAMLAASIYDPLDGAFFRSALTDDWRAFVPEKPLGVNAMLALILLDSGRRSEAVRLLDLIISAFALEGGALAASLYAPKSAYAFTPGQACAALGSEDGLRACRLLGLLHQRTQPDPPVAPSRFSPAITAASKRKLYEERPLLFPAMGRSPAPEDSAFLRRALPALLRMRAARAHQRPSMPIVCEHTALAAAVLAQCGKKLGEIRYTQAAQRAVAFLLGQQPASALPCPLPSSAIPSDAMHAHAVCGASAALTLALLTLGENGGTEEYVYSGLRLLGSALHAFVRTDGMVMHTPRNPDAFFVRVPAIHDGELPSPAALLVHSLRIAHRLRPHAHYDEAIDAIWHAAAPSVCQQPWACASLIDAMMTE